jgi:hypothetical protein
MRTTGYPQTEESGVAIAFYLAVCMFVCGLFGFGFYNLFQPRQFPNPGLTAYKPPPATVITYAATAHSGRFRACPACEQKRDKNTGKAERRGESASSSFAASGADRLV